ncbi:MAG: hypothetical protein RL085_260, partial [Actinomycetota bacterium]
TRVREQAAEAIANLLWDYLRP